MKQALDETFEDTGCQLHRKCLECTEPKCIEDMDGMERFRYLRLKRNDILADKKTLKR
jgi:hypothetical protein